MPPNSSQHLGIIELYRPKEESAEIDVVAVHGLQGDAIKTWTHDIKQICWLHHLLPEYIKNARVLTWGYVANTNSWGGKITSSDRILQHAETLVEELQNDRELEGATERPIIFICHSLGGIIVKRALTLSGSRTSAKTARLHLIYTCTYGILFFGTPHNGSDKARRFNTLLKLGSLFVPKKFTRFETSLVTGLVDHSETLQNISQDFAPLMSRYYVFFFWEQLRSDLKYTKDYVVDRESAAPILDGTDRCGIAADHQGMCKFQNIDSPGFKVVIAVLMRYCQAAPMTVKRRLIESARELGDRRRFEAMELTREA